MPTAVLFGAKRCFPIEHCTGEPHLDQICLNQLQPLNPKKFSQHLQPTDSLLISKSLLRLAIGWLDTFLLGPVQLTIGLSSSISKHSGAGLFVFSDSQHPVVWPSPVPHPSVFPETFLPVHYYLLTIRPSLWVLGTASSLSAVIGSGWWQCLASLFPDCSDCITDFRTFCSFMKLLELHSILFFIQKARSNFECLPASISSSAPLSSV